ncbi:hypothetical protein SAMN02799630_01776 [Paenibacillus sp. UNCCL117]|uniref:hypothetical protein n=1 Tax=unclassified Paenibacillus TaxID=185978 RepID=UPI00087EA47D|nr:MULTISPECIES: hypothetical protein [unclassified Paenibacillus]SDC93525.1 hypothetical protein SAMN04488602_104264 [Paenibacillus sp. cl123]SFW29580.1 hypothetical protein SAMN02799630_01776 [Paenibacillus sp. UNCCL117]
MIKQDGDDETMQVWKTLRIVAAGACLLSASAWPLQSGAALVSAAAVSDTSLAVKRQIGDDVGDVLATDIRAYVNGHLIRSMNIDGYTAVVAEDLRDYGFDVVWTAADRKVTILNKTAKPVQPHDAAAESGKPVGARLGDVLYTDISAYYGDTRIPSYNIGGQTAIRLNDLNALGTVDWDPVNKKIAFKAAAQTAGEDSAAEDSPVVVYERKEIRVQGIHVQDKTVTYEGKTVGKVVEGQPHISLAFMGEALGYRLEDKELLGCGQAAVCLTNGTYGFRVYPDQLEMSPGYPLRATLVWMGGDDQGVDVKASAADTKQDVLIEESDLKKLFGYASTWNPDTKMLDIRYADYVADEYGFPKTWNNYVHPIRIKGYMNGQTSVMPGLNILSIGTRMPSTGAVSSALVGEIGTKSYKEARGLSEYTYQTDLSYDTGWAANEIRMTVGERILFVRQLEYLLTPESMEPVIGYPEPFSRGEISRISFDQPTGGYIRTEDAKVRFSGKASKRVGSALTIIVEHQVYGGGYEKVKQFDVPFDGERFSFEVEPQKDPRYLTKITVQSTLSFPRGTSAVDAARFYIEKPAK